MSLVFIVRKSAGYGCAPEDLENELVQLGLPPEHSKMMNRIFSTGQEAIKIRALESITKGKIIHRRRI